MRTSHKGKLEKSVRGLTWALKRLGQRANGLSQRLYNGNYRTLRGMQRGAICFPANAPQPRCLPLPLTLSLYTPESPNPQFCPITLTGAPNGQRVCLSWQEVACDSARRPQRRKIIFKANSTTAAAREVNSGGCPLASHALSSRAASERMNLFRTSHARRQNARPTAVAADKKICHLCRAARY